MNVTEVPVQGAAYLAILCGSNGYVAKAVEHCAEVSRMEGVKDSEGTTLFLFLF